LWYRPLDSGQCFLVQHSKVPSFSIICRLLLGFHYTKVVAELYLMVY